MVIENSELIKIKSLLSQVCDPEIPVLTIEDLGILRNVSIDDKAVKVDITPTFTGCPAMLAIAEEITHVLNAAGYNDVTVKQVIAPSWTTDWMTEAGKKKLKSYGIAPPEMSTEQHLTALMSGKKAPVTCPFCNSTDTKLTSAFGSTACKALHYCNHCQQPFEEFKCH